MTTDILETEETQEEATALLETADKKAIGLRDRLRAEQNKKPDATSLSGNMLSSNSTPSRKMQNQMRQFQRTKPMF